MLLEIIAVTLLVIRNCVLALFRESAPRIKWNPLYLVFVAAPLRIFHGLVVLMRRAPGWGIGVMLGLAALSFFALGVGMFWRQELGIWQWSLPWPLWRSVVFIIGPVIVLLIECCIWLLTAYGFDCRDRRRQAMYQAAYAELNAGNYTQAIQQFHKFVRRFPHHELADNAQYWIGEAHLRQARTFKGTGQTNREKQEIEQAIREFNKVSTTYARGDKAPAAILQEALGLLDLQRHADAQARLQYLAETFRWTEEASRAREKLKAMD